MQKIMLVAVALMLSASAFSVEEPVDILWDGPTEWESGDALDRAVDISEYRLYCRRGTGDFAAPYVFTSVDGTHSTTRQALLQERGIYSCAISSVGADNGLEAELSVEQELRWTGPPGRARNLNFRRNQNN